MSATRYDMHSIKLPATNKMQAQNLVQRNPDKCSVNSNSKVLDQSIWELIAEYIQPSPRTYTRLARVNRLFYKVFLSDRLWLPFNFHGVKRAIHLRYYTDCKYFSEFERAQAAYLGFQLKANMKGRFGCTGYCSKERLCDLCQERYVIRHTRRCATGFKQSCEICYWLESQLDCLGIYSLALTVLKWWPFISRGVFEKQVQRVCASTTDNNRERVLDQICSSDKLRETLVHKCGLLCFANDDERKEFCVVLRAVQFDGRQLQFADSSLAADSCIVKAAITENLFALEYADKQCLQGLYELEMFLTRRQNGASTLPTP